ncbi:DUF262 domain-containing protein [Bacillus cereus]|uniref:DUF262 domain-containing protein n=1 Tax=Bacillus cereus TaxID=1396 RepID=UPI000278FCB8|nr:DUF262 domain-containing protein [Bacillus cereus]EJQ04153.1 hypothetical protein IE1_04557 [Bacillus cereus BAG3O-2]EJQ31987.1 hypothetical protein IE7_00772 [Bacillus cereus BAG4O-1]PEW37796.1 hypothetical protein CN436_26160 [Bacillus cereus]TNO64608.1 DUF262 domain-containing protein [Bacillus cereus]HDR8365018.1 DUF262 domain-containing protein [Bacillus cereus]
MYEIRPESVKTYLEDRKIFFPRFQRKQTWDDKKNFKLCISIFKNFPLGVVVLNREDVKGRTTKWLLDGRQRRNALMKIMENPEEIYDWARKFVKFKVNDQPEKIEEEYWKAIYEHLEKDPEVSDEDEGGAEEKDDEVDPDVEEETYSFQTEDEENNTVYVEEKDDDLKILLQLILAVHKKDKKSSGFSRPFDFSVVIDNLPYIEQSDIGVKLNGKKLRLFILEFNKLCYDENIDEPTPADFIEYLTSKFKLSKIKKKELQTLIDQKWERIKERLELIDRLESKLQEAVIGIIELRNASLIDAQNIFKLINSEGTPLTSEEILSSKPSWNIIIKEPSQELKEHVNELYARLSVKTNDVVRWDFPATLIGRLKDCSFLIKPLSLEKDNEFKSKITLGFKIFSAIYEKAINKNAVSRISRNPKIKWKEDLEQFIVDVNLMLKIISEVTYFKYLRSWNVALMEITSDAVLINFIAILYQDWERKGKPITSDAKKFQKNAVILFDRLIYEYLTRQWRGSSDSKIASNLMKLYREPDVFSALDQQKWVHLLDEIIDNNTINDDKIKKYSELKPLLVHYYCLSNIAGPDQIDIEVNIDHIYPQDLFNNSPDLSIDEKDLSCNNLFNLALLPKGNNIAKGNKKLKVLDDPWLIDQITKYTGILKSDFEKYSDINNINQLRDTRKQEYIDAFTNGRNRLFVTH